MTYHGIKKKQKKQRKIFLFKRKEIFAFIEYFEMNN